MVPFPYLLYDDDDDGRWRFYMQMALYDEDDKMATMVEMSTPVLPLT